MSRRPGDYCHRGQRAQLERMWKKYKGVCQLCFVSIPRDMASREHVIPLSLGGPKEDHNCVLACKPCNNNREYKIPSNTQPFNWDAAWSDKIRSSINGCIVRQRVGGPVVGNVDDKGKLFQVGVTHEHVQLLVKR